MTQGRGCRYCGDPLESYLTDDVSYSWRCVRKECQERDRHERQQVELGLEKERLARIRANPDGYLGGFGVPRKYLGCSLDGFEGGDKVTAFCREYVRDLVLGCAGNVLLTGGCGAGKTHLSAAILRQAICEGFKGTALFTTAPELLLGIREAFSVKTEVNEREVIDKYSGVDLLVLDDFGAEKQSAWAVTTLYLIIDRRLRDMKPTIVTTNLSLEDIATVISRRLASRLSDGRVIELKLPDYRTRR